MSKSGYYVCRYSDNKAIIGPFDYPNQAANAVMAQETPTDFYTMSRYMLAKDGLYPNNKQGNDKLRKDSTKEVNDETRLVQHPTRNN